MSDEWDRFSSKSNLETQWREHQNLARGRAPIGGALSSIIRFSSYWGMVVIAGLWVASLLSDFPILIPFPVGMVLISGLILLRVGFFGRSSKFDVIPSLRSQVLLAGVKAELKAQNNDQRFVELICHKADVFAPRPIFDHWLERDEVFETSTLKYFIVCCEVLAERLREKDVPSGDLERCAYLLQARCMKMTSSVEMVEQFEKLFNEWLETLKEYHAS